MPKGKPKSFSTPKRKIKAVNKPPETADEYLAAGVELEEAGEKWRAGDAAKASRFFVRAIEAYDEGLVLFPDSFDMAYNKARIQYDITQRPALLAQASGTLQQVLEQALSSHRHALALDSQNADVMFNTAQVLTSLADAIDDEERAALYLQEALKLFEECLLRQETLLAESVAQFLPEGQESDGQGLDGGVALDDPPDDSPDGSVTDSAMQWASIVEPTTKASLVETCLAALEALTGLYPLLLQPIVTELDQRGGLWTRKLEASITGVPDIAVSDEARCVSLKWRSASAEAAFRLGESSIGGYSQRLKEVIDKGQSNMQDTSKFLCSCADINIAFAVATADESDAASARWTKLTKALDWLEQASKLAASQEVASVHMGRGDVELFRFSLCLEGGLPENVSNETVQARLLKNAITYYRGAATTAASALDQTEVHNAAVVKLTICSCLGSRNTDGLEQLRSQKIDDETIMKVLNEMVDENLVSRALLQRLSIF